MIGIGIDTGGTCTDAVAYDIDTKQVLACAKSMTTHEQLEIGIGESIGKLPRELIDRAAYISLSTTLATNACVENKGGRVCLIFIGVEPKTLEENYYKYGFESTEFMRFLKGSASKGIEPDWETLDEMLPEILAEYDSIAISQLMPRDNNGQFEKDARDRILQKAQIPVICAYEIFQDLNVIKRGAGALLNARLIPVIFEFFQAVHKVLDDQQINLPFLIMRSDGSLVSEQYSMQYPVETLLCGPTASAKGAGELLPKPNAIVVDMGGTTSDIALIKNGEPKVDREGVSVGGWQTFVRGIDIDTFALGGDTQVCYKDRDLFLGQRRVMPISLLAGQYPQILPELERLSKRVGGSVKPYVEHLVLMKDISGREEHYTEREVAICEILKDGPLGVAQLAEKIHADVYYMHTERLEQEGILMRSGFTPTDAMVLLGDRVDESLSKEAAEYVKIFLAKSTARKPEEICKEVYRLVKERLYCNLVRILWRDQAGRKAKLPEDLNMFAKHSFASIMEELASKDQAESGDPAPRFYRMAFSTDAVLLGVGAPTHVFIDDVARALGTVSAVSEYSGVTNALGALLGDACVYETVHVKANYSISLWDEEDQSFTVQGDEQEKFPKLEAAIERAKEIAMDRARRKVVECGASDVYSLTCEVKQKSGATNLGEIPMGAEVTACGRGHYVF